MRRVLLVLVLAGLALAGVRGWQAAVALRAAEAQVRVVQSALLAGDVGAARSALPRLQETTRQAVRSTEGASWQAISGLPYAGRTPRAVTSAAAVVDALAREVLPPLLGVAERWTPERLRPAGDRIALDVVAAEASLLAGQQERVHALRSHLPGTAGLPAPLAEAVRLLADRLRLADDALATAAGVARLAPSALGGDGPRHWFVALQTNAESRGTGGLVGAYAVLTLDGGRLALTRLGSNTELVDLPGTRLPFGADHAALYGRDPQLWSGTNLSPHFPYAARLWVDKWHAQTGQRLDGALAADPVALAQVLAATGPVPLADGGEVSADNAVALTEQEAYARFDDEGDRKAYLVQVVQSVVDRLLSPQEGDGAALLQALAGSARQGRLLAWSAHPDEQAVLARTPLAGTTPDGPGPFAQVVVNNGGGNKLDYYLDREVDYALGPCRDGARASRVAVRLHNDVPGDLPHYVTGASQGPEVRGSHRLHVAVHATRGGRLEAASLDGAATEVFVRAELGRPVLVVTVDLAPGQERELVLHLREPAAAGDPVVREQPLARPQRTSVSGGSC